LIPPAIFSLIVSEVDRGAPTSPARWRFYRLEETVLCKKREIGFVITCPYLPGEGQIDIASYILILLLLVQSGLERECVYGKGWNRSKSDGEYSVRTLLQLL
tara:strand:- start:528 stop:833 length:306 start_codon:yes stop_codon:yes gene_type:complete